MQCWSVPIPATGDRRRGHGRYPLISGVVVPVFVGGELVVGAAFLAHLGVCRLGARRYRPPVVAEEEGHLLEVVVFTCGETPEVVGRTRKAAAPLGRRGWD